MHLIRNQSMLKKVIFDILRKEYEFEVNFIDYPYMCDFLIKK